MRSGTENVAAIVGFGWRVNARLLGCKTAKPSAFPNCAKGSNGAWRIWGATVFGTASERLPTRVSFAFSGIDGETLVGKLDGSGRVRRGEWFYVFQRRSGTPMSSRPWVSRPILPGGAVRSQLRAEQCGRRNRWIAILLSGGYGRKPVGIDSGGGMKSPSQFSDVTRIMMKLPIYLDYSGPRPVDPRDRIR